MYGHVERGEERQADYVGDCTDELGAAAAAEPAAAGARDAGARGWLSAAARNALQSTERLFTRHAM